MRSIPILLLLTTTAAPVTSHAGSIMIRIEHDSQTVTKSFDRPLPYFEYTLIIMRANVYKTAHAERTRLLKLYGAEKVVSELQVPGLMEGKGNVWRLSRTNLEKLMWELPRLGTIEHSCTHSIYHQAFGDFSTEKEAIAALNKELAGLENHAHRMPGILAFTRAVIKEKRELIDAADDAKRHSAVKLLFRVPE